jgi:hypothetical protein
MQRLTSGSSSYLSGPANRGIALALTIGALAACSDDESRTSLNTEGPPMVRQVFMFERRISGTSAVNRPGLAFGTHAGLPASDFPDDDGKVELAVNDTSQKIRIVLDELVIGNALEEIACADGSWSRVPLGATPDDVAACSGSPDSIPNCKGICIGPSGPIGILDVNFDGAADDLRMINYGSDPANPELAVDVVCNGERMPLDQVKSFYNPSGNQLVPAGPIGYEGLGPAIILVPGRDMRTGSACTLRFRDEVVDKDGLKVCAPPNGNVKEPCPGDGNTELVTFNTEPLALRSSSPTTGSELTITAGDPQTFFLTFNVALATDTLGAITLTQGATVVEITASLVPDSPFRVQISVPDGLEVDASYTITATTALTDTWGAPLPENVSIEFTTIAAP